MPLKYSLELPLTGENKLMQNLMRPYSILLTLDISYPWICFRHSQPAITCSKLTIETLEQGVSIVNFEQVNEDWVPNPLQNHTF